MAGSAQDEEDVRSKNDIRIY